MSWLALFHRPARPEPVSLYHCTKCNYTRLERDYRAPLPTIDYCGPEQWRLACRGEPEHFHRTCPRCGHETKTPCVCAQKDPGA